MSLVKEIKAITECSICTESFVDPRVLPCLHTFCLKCLESYGKSRKCDEGLLCPLCRATFDLPSKVFTELPVNFFILKLLDVNKVVREPNESVLCDACSEKDDDEDDEEDTSTTKQTATVYCFDCRQSLCRKCYRVHNRLRHNRCHLVVEFGKKQSDELLKMSPTYCEAHQDEIVKFYCSDCQKSICMSCYVEGHSTHKCCSITKVAEEYLGELQEDVTKVTEHIEKCLSEERKLSIKKNGFVELIKKKEDLVRQMVTELHDHVDAHGEQILVDLASVRQAKLKEFETLENDIQGLLIMLDSFKKYSQEVMKKATPADIASLSSMMKKRAAELHAMRMESDLCVYDIDIASLKLKQLLTIRDENSLAEVVIYNSREDNTEAYLSSSVALPVQLDTTTAVIGLTAMGNKLYLLRRERSTVESVQPESQILGAGLIRLQLQDYIVLNGTNHYRTSYTQCSFVVFHLQLLYSKATTGKTLQLEISDPHLAEADGNLSYLTNSITFNLNPQEIGQPSNINQSLSLRSPETLYNSGFYGMNINIQTTGSNVSLTVQASVSQFVSSTSYSNKILDIPVTYSTSPSTVMASPSSVLEIFDINVIAPTPGIGEFMKPTSIMFLPSVDPTDMVSCSYYDCLYIGDQSSPSIRRVDSRLQTNMWLFQNIPSGLSVTCSHTLLVTFSEVAKLLEYTTLGVVLREICLTGVIHPSHSVELLKDKFLVTTGTELYVISAKQTIANNTEVEGTENELEKISKNTETTEPEKGLEAEPIEEGSSRNTERKEDEAQIQEVAPEGETVNMANNDATSVVKQHDAENPEIDETMKLVAEKLQDLGSDGDSPIRTCIDQFGFIFVLTKTKVHLLSPELRYIRELVSLDGFGMQDPTTIYFHPKSGQLYVASTAGTKQFLVFQVTEGEVAQSVWKT